MLDQGNGQLSAVGFFNPTMGEAPAGEFFGGGAPAADVTLKTESPPPGAAPTEAKLLPTTVLKSASDSGVEFVLSTDPATHTTYIQVGVYYI